MKHDLREGDVKALLNKRILEGRPLKSRMIVNGDERLYYNVEHGKVRITEKMSTVLGVSQD